MNLGIGEIMLILVLALLIFGAKRLPEVGRSIGSSLKEFKKGMDIGKEDFFESDKDEQKKS